MSDSTGTPSPPGVEWPRNWRLWWDPKAPHRSGKSADVPIVDPMPDVVSDNPPLISGTGSPGCQVLVTFVPDPGGASGAVIVGGDGTWSYVPQAPLLVGDYCVNVSQRCEDPSEWSQEAQECFTLTNSLQSIDLGAKPVRYSSVNGWATYGTLAYKVNGAWTYGTLRRAVEVANA